VTDYANRMFTGFNPSKHLVSKDKSAPTVDVFVLGLAHTYGDHRQIALLFGVKFEDCSKRAKKIHVYREFKSGLTMGPPEIAKGIIDMINDVATSVGLHPLAFVKKLTCYGNNNAENSGNLRLYNTRIEEALTALGYEIVINTPRDFVGVRPECEALINAIAIADGLTANPKCELLTYKLQNHQCGTVDPVVDALRYGLYESLSASIKHSSQLYRG